MSIFISNCYRCIILTVQKREPLVIILAQIDAMPRPQDGSALWGCESIRAWSYLLCNLIVAFLISYELIVLARSSHILSSAKHHIAHADGMKFYR